MVAGRAHKPPQRQLMDHISPLGDHDMTKKDDKGDQPSGGEMTWTNKHYVLAEKSTRQANLETACWDLRPTAGHCSCLVMMMMYIANKKIVRNIEYD